MLWAIIYEKNLEELHFVRDDCGNVASKMKYRFLNLYSSLNFLDEIEHSQNTHNIHGYRKQFE